LDYLILLGEAAGAPGRAVEPAGRRRGPGGGRALAAGIIVGTHPASLWTVLATEAQPGLAADCRAFRSSTRPATRSTCGRAGRGRVERRQGQVSRNSPGSQAKVTPRCHLDPDESPALPL